MLLPQNGYTYFAVATIPVGGLIRTSAVVTLTVLSGVFEPGWARAEQWLNNPANSTAPIENDTLGPPDMVAAVPAFETRVNNGSENQNDGARVSGYVVPATSDSYVFFICSDDGADLFLSTDSNPAHKQLIAQENTWSSPWEWLDAEYYDGNPADGGETTGTDVTQKRSDQFSPDGGATVPFANGISLTAGQKYYLEADHWNGGGGDNVEVTWKKFRDPDPADGTDTTLTGNVIGIYVPKATYVAFPQEPQSISVAPFQSVSFTVQAISDGTTILGSTGNPNLWGTNNMFYQWEKNGQVIAGATTSTLTLTPAPWDNGAQITVRARALGYADTSGNPVWSNSTPAVLTVTTNVTGPPAIVSASFFPNGNNSIFNPGAQYVLIKFNKPMDPTSLMSATYRSPA